MKIQLKVVMLAACMVSFLNLSGKGQDIEIDERVIIKEITTNKSYGLKKKTCIKVGSIKNEYTFLAQLTGPNGEQISAVRLGSCCSVKSDNAPMGEAQLDRWQITYEGLDEPIILYINGYDYERPKCPYGLNFKQL